MIVNQLLKLIGRKSEGEPPVTLKSEDDHASELHVVTPGDVTHDHIFKDVPWEHGRFGLDFNDFEDNHRNPAHASIGTYKFLRRCTCGAEEILKIRAPI